jgi:hypothetical protein
MKKNSKNVQNTTNVGNEVLSDIMFSLPDIRNKLSPIKNLIAMLENGLVDGTIEVHPYILKEIEQCKVSITYLSGNEPQLDIGAARRSFWIKDMKKAYGAGGDIKSWSDNGIKPTYKNFEDWYSKNYV